MTGRLRRLAPAAAALLLLLGSACSSTPDGVIEPKRMARLLADLETGQSVIDADAGAYASDSSRRALRDAVCLRHGVTAAELDSSLGWYGRHVEKYVDVLDNTVEILEQRLADARAATVGNTRAAIASSGPGSARPEAVDGDSVDLWDQLTAYRLTAASPRTVITFVQNRNRFSEPGDIYQLRYRVSGPALAQGANVTATMAASYTAGGGEQAALAPLRHTDALFSSLRLRLDSTRTAASVFGAITVTGLPDNGAPLYIDSVSLVRLRLKKGR